MSFTLLLLLLLQELEKQRVNVVLEKTLYDLAAESALDKEEEQDKNLEAAHNKLDYLSAFLAQFPPGKRLTKRQALQAKDECLSTLKERLLERANIIQAHLDEENQALHQRRALFKRQSGTGSLFGFSCFSTFRHGAEFVSRTIAQVRWRRMKTSPSFTKRARSESTFSERVWPGMKRLL